MRVISGGGRGARRVADKALLGSFVDAAAGMEQAQRALVIAREVDEPALLSQALTACGDRGGGSSRQCGRVLFRQTSTWHER